MRRLLLLALALGPGALACSSGDDGTVVATTTTAPDACALAQAALGAADVPTDLASVASDAERIAAAAGAPGELDDALIEALAFVGAAATSLADAARTDHPASVADAAATLTTAYDELDDVAAALERADCSSESWGRQVAIAAIDLVGAGG